MSEITNEFSWSISRNQLFHTCPRAYYYNYYGYWMGWKENAPERTRKIYILRNMKPLVLWAGALVHDVIKETLTAYRENPQVPPLQTLLDRARALLRQGWVEAVGKAWMQRPNKCVNLFELYYGNGQTLPKEMTDALKERIYDALTSFYYSKTFKKMQSLPLENWRSIDILQTFTINGIKVFCALDACYVDEKGLLTIIDWKTGGENPASLRQQLACYALFAMQDWGVKSVSELSLNGVFLNDGGRLRNYPLDENALLTSRDQIVSNITAMRSMLRIPENNTAEEEDFPGCCDPATCDHCVFKEICPLCQY